MFEVRGLRFEAKSLLPPSSNLLPPSGLPPVKHLPPFGVGDGSGFADGDAGRRFRSVTRFAWSTMVANLFPFIVFYRSHGFFTKNVYFIWPHSKDCYRADLDTLTTAIALVCVQSEKPISRGVIKSVMSNHGLLMIQFGVRSS